MLLALLGERVRVLFRDEAGSAAGDAVGLECGGDGCFLGGGACCGCGGVCLVEWVWGFLRIEGLMEEMQESIEVLDGKAIGADDTYKLSQSTAMNLD